jgi:hypothetical protein
MTKMKEVYKVLLEYGSHGALEKVGIDVYNTDVYYEMEDVSWLNKYFCSHKKGDFKINSWKKWISNSPSLNPLTWEELKRDVRDLIAEGDIERYVLLSFVFKQEDILKSVNGDSCLDNLDKIEGLFFYYYKDVAFAHYYIDLKRVFNP